MTTYRAPITERIAARSAGAVVAPLFARAAKLLVTPPAAARIIERPMFGVRAYSGISYGAGRQNDVPVVTGFKRDGSQGPLAQGRTRGEYTATARRIDAGSAAEVLCARAGRRRRDFQRCEPRRVIN